MKNTCKHKIDMWKQKIGFVDDEDIRGFGNFLSNRPLESFALFLGFGGILLFVLFWVAYL